MDKINQRTLVLIKPDAMDRNLAGEIIARIERVGLKILDCKIIQASEEIASKHYPDTDEWLIKVGTNTLDDCKKYSFDVVKMMGTDDARKIGKMILKFNKDFLMSRPIIALIFEGPHAIEIVKKIAGHTIPVLSPAGTIRGDYSSESAITANSQKAPIRNLVHASGSVEEAQREIKLWFGLSQD